MAWVLVGSWCPIFVVLIYCYTNQWLKDIGGRPLKLGLDLSGGVHFLLEVDIESALTSRLDAQLNSYRKTFRDQKIYLNDSSSRAMTMIFEFKDSEGFSSASRILSKDNSGKYQISEFNFEN